jgi:hypothetical protein
MSNIGLNEGLWQGQIKALQERLKAAERERDEALVALTEIRDLLLLQQDAYARRVFAIAANTLEPD